MAKPTRLLRLFQLNHSLFTNKYNNYNNVRKYTQALAKACWKCGAQRTSSADLFCDKCNVVQNPHQDGNYFQVFGVTEKFEIDQKQLTQKFKKLQTLLHPDKFSNRTDEEKEISEKYSSLVNKAYSTLQVPLKRALHMLKLNNEDIGESNEISDKEFLMEIMELNEEIEEADTPEKLRLIDSNNKNAMQELTRKISDHFDRKDVESAKNCIIKLKYFNSMNSRIKNLLVERGITD